MSLGADGAETAYIDTRRIPAHDILGMMLPRDGRRGKGELIAEYAWFKNDGAGCTNAGA